MYPAIPDEVLAFHERFTLCVGAAVPLPVNAAVAVEFDALLLTVRVAFTVPEVVGLNVTLNAELEPAGIVTGSVSPPMLNTAESFVAAEVTVTLPPLALSVPDALALLPTTALPRFIALGVIVSDPAGDTPVPESATVTVGSDAFELILMLPLAAPAPAGFQLTFSVADCPGESESGSVRPLSENPLPFIAIDETVRPRRPEFVSFRERLCVLPVFTLPNERVVGLAESVLWLVTAKLLRLVKRMKRLKIGGRNFQKRTILNLDPCSRSHFYCQTFWAGAAIVLNWTSAKKWTRPPRDTLGID